MNEDRTSNLFRRLAAARALGYAQSRPDWLDQFKLRPKDEPLVLKDRRLQLLYGNSGISSLVQAKVFVKSLNASKSLDKQLGFYVGGSRNLCVLLSWLIETIEGRYEDEVFASYGDSPYLNSRYGIKFYNLLWHGEDF